MTRPLVRPLPGVIAGVSLLMCIAAAGAGLKGIVRPTARELRLARPVAERAAPPRMIGVAGLDAVAWDSQTGIRASLSVSYISMNKPVAPNFFRWKEADANGARPVIDILPRGRTLASVAAGDADGWLRSLRAEITEPVVIAFAPEADGNWYPWGLQPAEFVAAWRTVWSVLGTRDITWMWQMSSHDSVAEYWPGARYVDWVGVDGYFWKKGNTFRSLFNRTLTAVRSLTDDPVLLSETAVGPLTDAQTTDIAQLFAAVAARHLIGLVWFDVDQHQPPHHQDWYLAPGSAVLAAFRAAARAYTTPLAKSAHRR